LKGIEKIISKNSILFLCSTIEQAPRIVITKKPPGPPPGRPPILSDNEDISDDEEGNHHLPKFSLIDFILETSTTTIQAPQSNGNLIFKYRVRYLT
jgi:hypothetical protein